MAWVGLALLPLVGIGIITTGLPAAMILIMAASFGALVAFGGGSSAADLVAALPSRLIGLLENDLLQALPLYVLMGVLINRLPLADALYRSSLAILPRDRSAPLVAGLGLGALLGPMNGSVGASVLALSRVVAPRLAAFGIPPARRGAIVAVASTLGVVVPPSLVLILLGDAMLSAHTIAVTATGRDDRVINTQDVFRSALGPAAIYLALCLIIAWWFGRKSDPGLPLAATRVERGQALLAGISLVAILGLLGGVATGFFYAVEAAAMGAFALLVFGIFGGQLRLPVLHELLRDVMSLTGALFFLLIGATTLTLVLRVLGTDKLVGDWIIGLPGADLTVTVTVLAIIGTCALVLDAFEIIFVIIPIVIPPLLIRVADARWISTIVLLALQTSFLLPPFGYALMLVRGTLKERFDLGALVRELMPFLFAQWALLALVLFVPQLAHIGDNAADRTRKPAATLSGDEMNKRMRDMLPLPELPDLPELPVAPSR